MLKRSVMIVLALIVLFGFTGTVSAQKHDPAEVKKLSLVALGDSITSGYGLFNQRPNPVHGRLLDGLITSRDAYPQAIGDELGLRVNNLAVSGWTSNDLLMALLYNGRYRAAVSNADVILLNIGGNDVLGYLIEVDFENIDADELLEQIGVRLQFFYQNLGWILQQIRLLNPTAPILHYGFYNPLYGGHAISYALEPGDFWQLYGLLNQMIPLINFSVLNVPLPFVDGAGNQIPNPFGDSGYANFFGNLRYVDVFMAFELYGLTGDKADLFSDEVHPSATGHGLLTDISIETLLGYQAVYGD
jgi:lysophospholipase L1-like esterase